MLTGKNLLGGSESARGSQFFHAVDPATGAVLDPAFREASVEEMDEALRLATAAFESGRLQEPSRRAALLRLLAEEMERDAPAIIRRAMAETGLPQPRLEGECLRTTSQARLFASVVEEGSWVEARIDRGDPGRTPVPKPDLRRMLVPLGPVVVFGASNFPLAFSVAGGDTVSALAAGCPVVVKGHPAHPGTSELVARAVRRAVEGAGLPGGVFSLIHGRSEDCGLYLVQHPQVRAVGFTGSLRAGRTLFEAACGRPEPIPVYAEMGSVNPVFVLPEAMRLRAAEVARGLFQSFTLGVGQFCTKPGLVFVCEGEGLDVFLQTLWNLVEEAGSGTMLHAGICAGFRRSAGRVKGCPEVELVAGSPDSAGLGETRARPVVVATSVDTLARQPWLAEEVFGPLVLVVRCGAPIELATAARLLSGQLTATVHAAGDEAGRYPELLSRLRSLAGRLVFNGFPTGVEVGHAMHHGGPYPATTDPRVTSVGTAAIQRFARPVCYQNYPEELLPPELRSANPRGIWRLVDGMLTRGPLGAG
jgi:NADP-dependent aldehyde dehydrogenase